MENSLGSIIVQLKADTTNLQKGIATAKATVDSLHDGIKSFNEKVAVAWDASVAASKKLAVGLGIVGGAFGALMKFGIGSAAQIQATQQSMISLTGSTKDANKVLGELYKFVLGKPLTFPDASMAAKTLLGYGVAADKAVTLTEAVGKASIVTGGNFQQVALALGQINSRGKLMGQDALQLINNSIPVTTILAKGLGISIQEAADKMNGGQVSAEQFNDALVKWTNSLDIQKFGGTLQNRLVSLKGSLRALAFDVLGIKIDPIKGFTIEAGGLFDRFSSAVDFAAKNIHKIPEEFEKIKPLVPILVAGIAGGLTPAILSLTGASLGFIVTMAPWVAAGIGVYELIKKWHISLKDVQQTFDKFAKSLKDYFQPKLEALWHSIQSNLIPALTKLWKDVIVPLIPVIGTAIVFAIGAFIDIANVLTNVIGFLVSHFDTLLPVLAAVGVAFVGLKAKMLLDEAINAIIMGFNTLRLIAIPNLLASLGTLQAFFMTPWGIALTVAGLAVAALTSGFISNKIHTDNLKNAVDNLRNANYQLKDAQDAVKNAGLGLEGAQLNMEAAQRNYTDAVAKFGPNSFEARQALHEIHQAQADIDAAQKNSKDSLQKLHDKEREVAKDKALIKHLQELRDNLQYVGDKAFDAGQKIQRIDGSKITVKTSKGPAGNQVIDFVSTFGKRAAGGPVRAGLPYLVGEQGPELIVPSNNGTVIPNDMLRTAGNNTKIYGDINIGNKQDADYFFKRLDQNAQLESWGITPQ